MKTFITLSILIISLAFISEPSHATLYTIQTGNFFFNPSSLNNVHPGDTVRWVWVAGSHTTTSSTIPAGAASWDELITSSSTSYDYIPSVPGTYNYVCTPHVGMGMIGNFTVVSIVNPLSVVATADDNTLCLGGDTWLRAFPSGGTGTYIYSWTSNPPGFTSNQQNVFITPTITRTYTVTVTSGTQTANSSAGVSVTQPPLANAGRDTSYCVNVPFFTVTGSAANYASVVWTTSGDGSFGDPTSLTSTYTPGPSDVTSSSLNLVLSAAGIAPCLVPARDTVHIALDPCTGIAAKNSNASLEIRPNPSTGSFMISVHGLTGPSTLEIFDVQGKLVFKDAIEDAGFSRYYSLNGLSGLYQAYVRSGNQMVSTKLLIVK